MSDGVLLDTHALIWIVLGASIREEAAAAVVAASVDGGVHVSAATAWELGVISQKRSLDVVIGGDVRGWLSRAVRATRAHLLSLDVDLMLDVGELPDLTHRDPTDRMLIATARAHDLILITRDRAILAYAAAGHVRAVAC
ncbi:type II toxin-antitoxin system VapC family toxin [Brevundimonas sp.]|uniref:type II toxin-antitoxin system VapC family toxin n=1 Tax=Brevundimonas sp. TaxID=1871086 RepID=UPI00289ED14F|nr:type II toxin-antitoxin system VapC family toxin [Brevundimonas sp.]